MQVGRRWSRSLIVAWTLALLLFTYLPIAADTLASINDSRYFAFPIKTYGFGWWEKTFSEIETWTLIETSLTIALLVTVISVVIAFFGALAFAWIRLSPRFASLGSWSTSCAERCTRRARFTPTRCMRRRSCRVRS
jgi:ABC-type spermidine/putrescine transport system permease subunit II